MFAPWHLLGACRSQPSENALFAAGKRHHLKRNVSRGLRRAVSGETASVIRPISALPQFLKKKDRGPDPESRMTLGELVDLEVQLARDRDAASAPGGDAHASEGR